MYKYFCGGCGCKFTSDQPERDSNGILNDIPCPNCGAWDIYPDTDAGRADSLRDQIEYYNKIESWTD